MTFDEYLDDCEIRRDALKLQLSILMSSDIPRKVKNERIKAITQKVIALKNEILAALAGHVNG